MAVYPNLLNARTTNGSTTPPLKLNLARGNVREGSLVVWGVFDGATVQIEDSMDGTKWFAVPNGLFTIAGTVSTDFRKNFQTHMQYVRATVAGATGNTSVSAHYQ